MFMYNTYFRQSQKAENRAVIGLCLNNIKDKLLYIRNLYSFLSLDVTPLDQINKLNLIS